MSPNPRDLRPGRPSFRGFDTLCTASHCQDLGQQCSEPDPGFVDIFFYILVCAKLFLVLNRPASVISRNLDNTHSGLHVASGFLKIHQEFMILDEF